MTSSISVTISRGGAANPANRIYITTADGKRVVFPITDPKVDQSNMSDQWEQIPRPIYKPLLRWKSPQLRVLKVSITVDSKLSLLGSAVNDIQAIRGAAQSQEGVVLVLGETESGFYSITDMSMSSVWREPGTNNIKQATIGLELTEQPEGAPNPPAPAPPKIPGVAATPATIDPAATKAATIPATYTVQAGDSLYSIARRFYGNGELWTRLGDANGITNPTAQVIPGLVLKLR